MALDGCLLGRILPHACMDMDMDMNMNMNIYVSSDALDPFIFNSLIPSCLPLSHLQNVT